jgi:hypothetical protein
MTGGRIIHGRMQITGGPKALAANWPQIGQEEFQKTGQRWHSEFMPLHFEGSASQRYAYQPRSVAYQRAKMKRWGQDLPLRWSGNLADMVRQAAITAGPDMVKVVMAGPRYMYAYRKDYRQPDKADELTRTPGQEKDALVADLCQRIQYRIDGLPTQLEVLEMQAT